MQFVSSTDSHIHPLPFRFYFWVVVFLAGSGLTASIYLSISHFRVYTDISYRSFCAISRAINCDTVSQSPYAIFLDAPLAVWGILGYMFLLIFIVLIVGSKNSRARGWAIAFTLSLAFSGYSVVLAFISSYYIHAYCIVCIYTYAANFLLAYMTWLVRMRFENKNYIQALRLDMVHLRSQPKLCLGITGALVCCIIAISAYFPSYWKLDLAKNPLKLTTGITEDGHPWIGSDSANLVITEYSDYLCFQCKKMNYYIRQLIARHPGRIKLIHRHFPMDSRFNPILKAPFHEGAGIMSLVVIHAAENGKFWPVNDYFFKIAGHGNRIDIGELSAKLGLNASKIKKSLNDPNTRQKLLRDIEHGLRLGITGTPSYEINGKVYHGNIPGEIIKKVES